MPDPHDVGQLADAALRANDFAAAEKECRRRLGVQPDDAEAMVSLAMALSSQAPELSGLLALLADEPRLKAALEWRDKAVAAGYRNRQPFEQSPYLHQVREQSSFSFNQILSKIPKSPSL